MARFTVIWPKDVDDAYVDLWLRSDSPRREVLTQAAHLIQIWLGNIPANIGRPVGSAPGMRGWVLPLDTHVSVLYHVNEPDRLVTILQLIVKW